MSNANNYIITSGPTKVSIGIRRSAVFDGGEAGRVTVKDHFDNFNMFSATDVWTQDGWLITSCFECNGGISHQLRKGYDVQQAIIPADTVLFYQPNQVTPNGFPWD